MSKWFGLNFSLLSAGYEITIEFPSQSSGLPHVKKLSDAKLIIPTIAFDRFRLIHVERLMSHLIIYQKQNMLHLTVHCQPTIPFSAHGGPQ